MSFLWTEKFTVEESSGNRKRVLKLLHMNHPGIVTMKTCARSYVWGLHLDRNKMELVEEFHS